MPCLFSTSTTLCSPNPFLRQTALTSVAVSTPLSNIITLTMEMIMWPLAVGRPTLSSSTILSGAGTAPALAALVKTTAQASVVSTAPRKKTGQSVYSNPSAFLSLSLVWTGYVSDILFYNNSYVRTQNVARIKTWQGGRGYVKNITYRSLRLTATQNSVFITQYYCPGSQHPGKDRARKGSGVKGLESGNYGGICCSLTF